MGFSGRRVSESGFYDTILEMSKPRILLLHLCSPSSVRLGKLKGAAGRTPPVGMISLAGSFPPGEVGWIDLQDRLPDIEDFQGYSGPEVSAILLQPGYVWPEERGIEVSRRLAAIFPNARRILVALGREEVPGNWDHLLNGTGRTLIEFLLAGTAPGEKFLDTLEEDLRRPLAGPTEGFPEAMAYSSGSGKSYRKLTVSVYQPWLGLLDRARMPFGFPERDFLARLRDWLKKCGFHAVSWDGPTATMAFLERILQTFSGSGIPHSFTVDKPLCMEKALEFPREEVFRIWLRSDSVLPDDLEPLGILAQEARRRDVGFGLRIRSAQALVAGLSRFQDWCDEIWLEDPGFWSPQEVKRVMADFYLRRGGLLRSLIRIRSGYDLIRFMKGAFALLDIILNRPEADVQ